MKSRSTWLIIMSLVIASSLILAACGPDTIIETVVVETQGETIVKEVLITPTDEPIPQGGTVITSTFADAQILNPILSSDNSSSTIHQLLYIGLLGTDPYSGETIGEAATDWDVSEDGLTYTFHMRDDIFWSDGTALTANDFKFTYDAIASELVESPRKYMTELIGSIDVVDDYTVSVSFTENDCTALLNLGIGILPAHLFAADFSDVMDSSENQTPTVVSGPFMLSEWVKDDHVTLVPNATYYKGAPNVDAWIYRIFADESAELAAFLAGELEYTGVSAQYVSMIEGRIASGEPFSIRKFFDDGFSYLGLNMANPENPQIGWVDENEDELWNEGEPWQEQEAHPILKDKAVRQAIAYSVDVTNIINKVIFGQGARMVTNVLPGIEWAFNAGIEGYDYDTEMAEQILDDAGWVDSNGDGVRDKDGVELHLRLMTNQGNEIRENIVTIVKDNLDGIGFDIELEVLEWGTVVGSLLGQTFDIVMIGWTGVGSDPEDSVFWLYRNDEPGAGFNFVSYYNEEIEQLLVDARIVPGCSVEDRGALYNQVQEILVDDAVYIFLYVPLANTVWNNRLGGIDPAPWSTVYNIEQWYIAP